MPSPTTWIRVREVRIGDRVKVPGFSSWSRWACQGQAERSSAPFREVSRVLIGWEGTSRIRLVFRDGYACQMLPDAGVLRERR